jgi:hypothetical protein
MRVVECGWFLLLWFAELCYLASSTYRDFRLGHSSLISIGWSVYPTVLECLTRCSSPRSVLGPGGVRVWKPPT